MPDADARPRVLVQRCKPCANPHDRGGMAKYFPAGLAQYVLNNFSKKSPPYRATQNDVPTPLQRPEVEEITGHQSVRGRGGVIAVIHETHWTGLYTVLGAGNEPLPRDIALLGRQSESAPPN